nr:VOC family protein [Neolewinella litorea]
MQDLDQWVDYLNQRQVETEPVRVDEFTDRRFTFFNDPDGLPIELYALQ